MSNGLPSPEEVLGVGSKLPSPEQVLGVKKKDLTASGSVKPSSERLSTTTTIKPTVSSSSKGKSDGTYSFPGEENAIYKKENGQWFKSFKGEYKYYPITKGDVQNRLQSLEKNAVSLENYSFEKPEPKMPEVPKELQGDRNTIEYWDKLLAAGKVNKKTYDYQADRIASSDFGQAVNKAAAPKPKQTAAQKAEQELFKTSFGALDVNDPEYLRRKAQSDKIDKSLSLVTPDFVNDNEEDVVPVVERIIKDYPYLQVAMTGFGYDELRIVNTVTGEDAVVNLENWSSGRDKEEANILRGFLDVQMNSKEYVDQKQKVDKLQVQMQTATPTQRIELSQKMLEEKAKLTDLSNMRYNYAKNDKYKAAAIYDKNAKENIKTDFAKLQIQSIDYSEKAKNYNEWNATVNEARKNGTITEEQYNTEYAPKLAAEKNMLVEERNKISEQVIETKDKSVSIDNIAANQYAIQAERGNVLSGATYSFLQGAENSLRFLLETGDFQDGEFKGLLTEAAPGSVSDVYTSAEGRNAFEQIVFGLANSGGSALVGAAVGSPFLGLYASSYVNMKDQMNTPEFKDVPEYQKILMSGVYGVTVGVLEKYGVSKWFTKTPAGKGLTNFVLKRTIAELGKDASAEAIELAVKKNLGAAITNGLIQVTSSGITEGSTELAQEAADMVYKDVFNKLSEKKYFDNPGSWAGVADRLSQSFILGFAGGAGMQSITQATQVSMNELNKAQINNITDLIESPELKDTFKLHLKDQIISGEISKDEAKRQIDKINQVEGVLNKIPAKVDKFEAFKLITERDELQKEIAGKDPALVAAQTERVSAINDELKQLSYAVQEQATSEVPVQPGAESSGEMAQGKPEAGSQEVTQEGEKVNELQTVRDRILKIEEAKKKGELLEGSQPGELKSLKERESELVQKVEERQSLIDAYVQEQTEYINGLTVINQEEKQELIDELVSDPIAYAEKRAGNSELFGETLHTDLLNSLEQQPAAQEAGVVQEQTPAAQEAGVAEEQAQKLELNIVNNENINDVIERQDTETKQKIAKSAKLAIKAIPKAKIYLHNNTAEYDAAVGEQTEGKEKGSFIASDGAIHINMQEAFPHTLLHEAFHYVILNKGLDAVKLNGWVKGLRSIVKDKKLLNRLDNLLENYSAEEQSEEFISELGSIMGAAKGQLSTNALQKFKTLINKIAKSLGLPTIFTAASTKQEAVDFINTISKQLVTGEEIEVNEPGIGGEIGTFNVPKRKLQKTIRVSEDPRDFIRKFVEDINIREFNGKKFITNMYDYTNAGDTDLGNGFKITMLGGKNYVPLMMELNGKVIGDVSNLAAFNTREQAETFIRNAELGGANLFAPHAGTLDQSWQFQQHTFAELFNLVLDNDILTPKELIGVFNNTIKDSKDNQKQFNQFATKYGEDIKNFDSFESDPKKIIDLLDIKNNYSPKLRKALNNAIASNKKFQQAIGVKNKNEFYNRIMDPLNQGMKGGEIMNIVDFDPTTFQIVETKPNNTDHHPSFGFALLAKINGIYQPTELVKSVDITDSYTKYNQDGEKTSRKAEEPKFEEKNVSSSAGAIPKTAEFNIPSTRKKQLVYNASPRSVEELGKRSGVVYFATDKREANAYAEGNRGQVREFEIPQESISDEKVVVDKINELGLQPKDKQYTVEESNLYELIDDRFDNSLSQSDIKKLFDALKKDGVTAFRYKDGAQVVEGTTESIAVIDTNVVQKSVRKKQISPKQNWIPTPVKNMNDSPIAKNSDKVRNAAVNLIKGLINVEDYRDIVNKFSPIKSIGTLFAPSTIEHMELALGKKAYKLMAPVVDENGEKLKKVGTRLDIPSYLHHNAWVVTVHDERVKNGPVVSYRNAVKLKNVEFSTDPRAALQIAAGYKGKSTFARMVGEMVDIPGATAEEQGLNAQLMVEDIMNDPNWVQVGMNPFRHSFFWNRATGMPVVSADEVIQIGGLVYAKNIKETSPNSEEFAVYGELDESGKKPSIKASDKPMLDKSGKKIKFQKAPKILGVKPTVVIVNDEQKALVDQIKLEVRAQREQKKAYKQVLADISARVTALKSKGNISVKQFDAIMKNLKRLNFDNETKVQAFIDYVSRALANADYVEKVARAQSLNKRIKASLKGTANPFAVLAKMFTTLDSRWVQNIDDHIAVAQMILDGVKPSTARRGVLTLKEEPDLQVIAEYIDAEQTLQTKMLLDNLKARYERITGKPSASLDAETMLTELQGLNPTVDQTDNIKQQIDEKLAEYAEMLTDEDPQVIVDAINIDTDIMDWKDAVKILDSLDTYFTNGSLAGIESLVGAYKGIQNVKKFRFKSKPMSIAMSKKLGSTRLGLFAGFSRILERKFRSTEKANMYQNVSGINDIITGANRADFEAAKKQKEYIKKFEKVKDFYSNENIYERGVIADLIRTNPGIDQDAEFERLVNILMDSKDMLLASKDNVKVEMGKTYDQVFKKLGLYDADADIESVKAKATKTNIDAVNFVVDMFAEKYDLLSDTAMGVYNIMLGQDINYTPKTYVNDKTTKSKDSDPLGGNDVLGLGAYTNASFNRNEAGVLMPITRPKDIKSNGKYVDLNFDNNMFRSYRLALTDAYTATGIRQLNSFYNSKENEDIIGSEKDFDIIKAALVDYINTIKGKHLIDKNLLQGVDKWSNMVSTFGAVRALVGIGQAANQFASGMSNTIVNAGEHIRPSDFTKKAFDFMNKSGQPIANVGENDILISLANFDKSIERATFGKSIAEVGLDKFAKFNAKAFQMMVSNPDAIARRLAWMAYYRKYAIKNKLGPIDFNAEPNAEAAAYAQSMVDRSMDTTDARVRGEVYRSQNTATKILRSVFIPFSSFGMNQKTRMWGDLTKLVTGDADLDTARSLASITAEIYVYNMIRFQMAKLILYGAMNLLGYDEEEQDELIEKMKRNMLASSWSKAIVDVVSPLALADNFVLKLSNWVMSSAGIGEPDKKEIDDYIKEENDIRKVKNLDPLNAEQEKKKREDFMKENSMQFYISDEANFGTLGIQWEKMSEAYDILAALKTGKYTNERKQDKYFDKEGMSKLESVALLKMGGVIAPVREFDQIANKSFKLLKDSNTMSEKKHEMIDEVRKKFGKLDPVLEKLAEKKNKLTSIEAEIKWINDNDGLKGSKEKEEYAKLIDVISQPTKDMLIMIQRGRTAQYIIDQELKK